MHSVLFTSWHMCASSMVVPWFDNGIETALLDFLLLGTVHMISAIVSVLWPTFGEESRVILVDLDR